MQTREALAALVVAMSLLSAGAAVAQQRDRQRGREQYVAPGQMSRERARIMGFDTDDDPRAAAEKRRNLTATDEFNAKVLEEQRRERNENKAQRRRR